MPSMGATAIAAHRRTQGERSHATQGRILEATLKYLAEIG